MSSQTVYHDLCNRCAIGFEDAPAQVIYHVYQPHSLRCTYLGTQDIRLEKIAGSTSDKGHTPLLDILFQRLAEATCCGHEGEEMPPTLVYKLGGRYIVDDDGHSLAEAQAAGKAFIRAAVWEYSKGRFAR